MQIFQDGQNRKSGHRSSVDSGDDGIALGNAIPSIEVEFGSNFNHDFQYASSSAEGKQTDQDASEPRLPRPTIKDLYNATPRPSPSPSPASRENTPGTMLDLDDRFQHLSVISNQARSESMPGSCSTISDLYDATPRPSLSPEPTSVIDTPTVVTPGAGEDHLQQGSPVNITSKLAQISLRNEASNNGTPYRVEYDEALPNEPYFDQDFQRALKAAVQLTKTVSNELRQCQPPQNSNLFKLLRGADELQDFAPKTRRTIGLIGDSAAGKSSLINSLLDQPNLAHKGDLGFAVTSFVTEYRYKKLQQSEPFVIEMEYLNIQEIDEQLDELVFSSRKLLNLNVNEISEKELERLEKESELAFRTLQSIFPNHPHLSKQYLEDTSTGAEENISSDLKEHARRLRWPEGAYEGNWSSTAPTAEACYYEIERFMSQGFWPLIKVVRVFLRASVLKTGIILADLPGYRDVNLARVKATERYLLTCDEVFVVANINRVLSNKTVETSIRQWLGDIPDPRKNVVIICTHADVIDLADAEKEFCDKKKVLNKNVAILHKRQINAASERSVREYEIAKLIQKYFFVNARNNYVKAELRKIYSGDSLNIRPDIFCVANQDYRGADIQKNNKDALTLAIQNSGVPELRRFCHSVMAKAKFEEANHYLRNQVFGLVESIELWLDVASKPDHSSIPATCGQALKESISFQIHDFHNTADDYLYDQIIRPMTLGTNDANKKAIEASEEWIPWHHTSYAAWARRNGTHETRTVGRRCWNAEILAGMNDTMLEQWTTLEKHMEMSISSTQPQASLRAAINRIIEDLRGQLRTAEAPPLLLQVIATKERELLYQVDQAHEELLNRLHSVMLDSTSTHITSYICQQMIPTYRDCSRQSGTGMKARMHGIMEQRLNRRDIFTNIREQIRCTLSKSINDAVASMLNSAENISDAIEQEIKTVREAERNKGFPEDVAKVREVVKTAQRLRSEIQRDASRALKEARARGYAC